MSKPSQALRSFLVNVSVESCQKRREQLFTKCRTKTVETGGTRAAQLLEHVSDSCYDDKGEQWKTVRRQGVIFTCLNAATLIKRKGLEITETSVPYRCALVWQGPGTIRDFDAQGSFLNICTFLTQDTFFFNCSQLLTLIRIGTSMSIWKEIRQKLNKASLRNVIESKIKDDDGKAIIKNKYNKKLSGCPPTSYLGLVRRNQQEYHNSVQCRRVYAYPAASSHFRRYVGCPSTCAFHLEKRNFHFFEFSVYIYRDGTLAQSKSGKIKITGLAWFRSHENVLSEYEWNMKLAKELTLRP